MAISRSLVLLFVAFIMAGCSAGDPHQEIVRRYLKRHHGSDPVTIVKSYKASKPDDLLLKEVKEVQAEFEAIVQIERDKLTNARKAHDDFNSGGLLVTQALENRELKERLASQVEDAEARVDGLNRELQELVASGDLIETIVGVRLQYRVPNRRGENALRDDLFIILNDEVDSVRDLLSSEGTPLSRFGRRAFPD